MNKEESTNAKNTSEIESKVITVGSNQGHKALIVIILVLLAGVAYHFYFSSSPNEEHVKSVEIIKEKVKQNAQELKAKLEQVPDNTMIFERMMIEPLPPLPSLTTPQIIPEATQIKKEKVVKKEKAKPKETPVSNIPILPKPNFSYGNITSNLPAQFPVIVGGGYPKDRRSAQMLAISGSSNGEYKAADAILSNTSAQSSKATKVGKLGFMITQGKIIDAVLETAIASNLQGMLRAVVSSDVYAETGDTVLIPKGSRLIGDYSFDSNVARARININWNRVILPHGIDIAISSPGTDELGRAGVNGIVDSKIVSALFSSIMLAGISIGSAVVGQKVSNLINTLNIIGMIEPITASQIDFTSLKDMIRLDNTPPINQWKFNLGAIGRMKGAKSEEGLVEIMKEEIAKSLNITEDRVDIDLNAVTQLLQSFQKASDRGSTDVMNMMKSINVSRMDFSPFKDMIEIQSGNKPSSDQWKLGLGAISKIQNAQNNQDLVEIVKEEIAKSLDIAKDHVEIDLNAATKLLQQFQKKNIKSVYEDAIGKFVDDFSKDMRGIVNKYIDKEPIVYVDQGTALKVFVNQDIVFPPQAILN